MQKWQHCELTVEYGGPLTGVNAELTWWHPDGQARSSREKLGKIMQALSDEGWELVSTSVIQGSAWGNRRVVHMFKRPAP